MKVKKLVILSGGQDSTVCLAVALADSNAEVHALTFNYAQRHELEVYCAENIVAAMDVAGNTVETHTIMETDQMFNGVTSALLEHTTDISAAHPRASHLPASFVPNRNAKFLTMAHGYAQEIGATELFMGVCETDYSGYPDCRAEALAPFMSGLNLMAFGNEEVSQKAITLHTPLMYLNKAQIWRMAGDISPEVLEITRDKTMTCYDGVGVAHHWGMGCGVCAACKLRLKGFNEAFGEQLELPLS